jgi:hypothetical protein
MKGSPVALTWLDEVSGCSTNSASVEEERGYNCIPRGKRVWHYANTDATILIADHLVRPGASEMTDLP